MSIIGKWIRVGGIAAIMIGALSACGNGEGGDPTQAPTMAKTPTITEPNTPTAAPTETATPKPTETPVKPVWNLEIPATPEECINVIRDDTFEHTSEDIASLNQYIMEQRPDGEVFPEMSFYRKKGFIPRHSVAFDFFDIESHSADGSTEYNKLLSCSKYGDGIVYGFFLPVGSGENQAIIPVQVFFNTALVEQQAINAGISVSNKAQAVINNNNQGKNNTIMWRLSGHFADTEEQYKNFSSAKYGRYLDETYDYSNCLELLINHYREDPQRDKETIELLQKIMLPGLAIPVDS